MHLFRQTANENISIILYSHTKKAWKVQSKCRVLRTKPAKKIYRKSRNVAIDVPGFLFCIILLLLHSVEFKGIEPAAFHFVGVYLREYELCFTVVVFDGYGRVMR